jgi:hypothetical protein
MVVVDDIPGWYSCSKFFQYAVDWAAPDAHFVEVGVLFGCASQQIAKMVEAAKKNITLTMVDAFDQSRLGGRAMRHMRRLQPHVKQRYGHHNFRLTFDYLREGRAHSFHPHNVIQAESPALARHFKDHSLDFVFLDNTHSTEHVVEEIKAWKPKLKPNGLLCGKWAGVIDGVFTPHPEIEAALEQTYGVDGFKKIETAWYVHVVH